METDPEKGRHGHANDLASQQDISELLHMAQVLVRPADEKYEAESHYEIPEGSICFSDICFSDVAGTTGRAYMYIYGPQRLDEEGDDATPQILAIGFAEEAKGPYLINDWEGNEPDIESMEHATEICTELILSEKLDEIETAVLININAFLTGQIHNLTGNYSEVELANGSRLKCAAAIGRAVARQSADFMVSKIYNDDVGDSELTIIRYDKTDPYVFEDYSGTTIELSNELTDEYVKLHIEDNGTAAVTETEDALEGDYYYPEQGHIAELQAAVHTVHNRIYHELEEDERPKTNWEDYVASTLRLFSQMERLPATAPENVKADALAEYEEEKAALRQAFENKYGLNQGLDDLVVMAARKPVFNRGGEMTLTFDGNISMRYKDIKVTRLTSTVNGITNVSDFITVLGKKIDEDGTRHEIYVPLLPGDQIIIPAYN